MSTLTIVAPLSEPPTESFAFRDLTYFCQKRLELDVLIEAEKEIKDAYYAFLRRRGLWDYVNELVEPQDVMGGVRLDFETKVPFIVIKTRGITLGNFRQLQGQIEFLCSL